jgi:formamidopyrimidine-DNA glycosylase
MPELPEVETMARDLAPRLIGRRIARPFLARPQLADHPDLAAVLAGARITGVRRRAKTIVIELDRGALLLAPRMTGAPRVDPTGTAPARHDHFGFDLVADRKVEGAFRWRDPRMFGRIRYVLCRPDGTLVDVAGRDPFASTGPEPLEIGPAGILEALARRPRTGAKAALLDQSLVAGIGNIYADEALWRARIHPREPLGAVDGRRLRLLGRAIVELLTAGIADRGARVATYAPPDGGATMQLRLKAYGRGGLPCARCAVPLERGVAAGRTTVWCSTCQEAR